MSRPLSVRAAVERDLKGLPDDLARSGLAVSALALARRLDDPKTSAAAAAAVQGRLADALVRLRSMVPPEVKGDGIDQLAERRADRLAS